jgi:NAD(P)-dependent dehydrogenase (short-subunit alcohol dehydrogenase family)
VNQFPEFNLTGKIALVTGSARGLGRAISLALAHAGADVAVGFRDVGAHGGYLGRLKRLAAERFRCKWT